MSVCLALASCVYLHTPMLRCSVFTNWCEYQISKTLSERCDNRVDNTTLLKSVFLEVDVEPLQPVRGHTHGESAAARSTASLLIDRVGQSAGLETLYYQGSSADIRNGRLTSRSYYWAKDFMSPPSMCDIQPHHCVAMVDVDYYVDMNDHLVKNFQPHILYSFVPSNACKCVGEYKYCFNCDGSVTYTVSGGGSYTHELWDWDGDSLSVSERWLGFTWSYATYAIERRRIDDDHQVILLAPIIKANNPFTSYLASRRAYAKQLKRLNPLDRGFVRLVVNDEDALWVCTGKAGEYSQCKVPCVVDSAIASAVRTSKNPLTHAAVRTKMRDGGLNETAGSEVLHEYHSLGAKPGHHVSLLARGVRRFQWVDREHYDEDARPGMVAFMKPLFDGGFVPDMCIGNDRRAVDERVEKLKNKTKIVGIDRFVNQCMEEFISVFLPIKNCFDPVDIEDVYMNQPKPNQRRILDNAQHEGPTQSAQNFVKREAYQSPTDPRMISQINGSDKMNYSRYIYPIADHIKHQHWYAFGKTPREISERVAEVCYGAESVSITDFSRMDGRVGPVAREFERRVMMHAFAREHHVELYQLMRRQYCLHAKTPFGVHYDTGYARSSGSAETSAFNTLLNAFICFMAYRRMRDEYGNYYNKSAAYAKLGIYGGDDGLSANICPKAAEAAASSLGQKLELELIRHGEHGVEFLARRYGPDVWFGDPTSCCKLARQLSKFHLTVHLPSNITPVRKLQEKSFAFCLTDWNTPIIGHFVRKVLELYPLKPSEFTNCLGIWRVEMDVTEQYPNDFAEWMEDYATSELPEFDAALFREWLGQTDHSGIFYPPSFSPRVEAAPKPGAVVVDGELMISEPEASLTPSSSSFGEPKNKSRFRPRKPKKDRAHRTRR